jgi:hypothetical protein
MQILSYVDAASAFHGGTSFERRILIIIYASFRHGLVTGAAKVLGGTAWAMIDCADSAAVALRQVVGAAVGALKPAGPVLLETWRLGGPGTGSASETIYAEAQP